MLGQDYMYCGSIWEHQRGDVGVVSHGGAEGKVATRTYREMVIQNRVMLDVTFVDGSSSVHYLCVTAHMSSTALTLDFNRLTVAVCYTFTMRSIIF